MPRQKPKRRIIPAAHRWNTNAELIADVAKLGYLDGLVMDPTYGRGKWWTIYQPDNLVAHDLKPAKSPIGYSVDFTDTPWEDESFDSVAFDPAYMAPGGRKSSTIGDFNDRFGLHTTPHRPEPNQELMNAGITEAYRVLKLRGFLVMKCMDYINAGAYWPGTHHSITHALSLGFELVDRFEHVATGFGPQPKRKRQLHARRNLSTLLVFKKRHAKK